MQRILLILALVALAGPTYGQEASIQGYVLDGTSGEPLLQANVAVAGTGRGTSTNQAGYYTLTNLEAGSYTLMVSYLGYRTARREVTLASGEDRRLDIELTPADILMEEVTVSDEGSEEERDVGVNELSTEMIKQLPAVLAPDVFRSLQLLPGVKAASDYSSGLYIRGGSPDQTLILLDRTTVYSPSHFFGLFSTFNPDAIKDVRLYKGGYPAEYGGRLGSVVDIRNKDGNRREMEGVASVGLLSSRAMVEGPSPGGSWMLAVRRSTLEPLLAVLNEQEVEGIPSSFYFYDVNGKVNVDPSENDRLSLSFYTGSDALNISLFDDEAALDLTYGNRTVSLDWTRILSEKLFSNLTLTGSHYASEPILEVAGTTIRQHVEIGDYSAKGDLEYVASDQHVLEAGFWSGHFSFGYQNEFDDQVTFSPELRSFYGDAYVQDTYEPSSRWQIRGGLRISYFGAGRFLRLAPRLSLEFRPVSSVRLQAGYGRYNQFLTLVSRGGFSGFDFWLTADEGVPPSYGDQFVAGVKTDLGRGLQLDLEGYYRTMRDLFRQDPFLTDAAGVPYPDIFQFGRGFAYGVEALLRKRQGPLSGFVAYTYGRTRRRFPEINEGAYYPPKYDRTHDVNVVMNYDITSSWRATGVFTYATGQPYTRPSQQYKLLNDPFQSTPRDVMVAPFNNQRLPPYHRLDLGVSKRGRFFGFADYEAQFQVINIYKRRNIWFYNFNFTGQNTVERQEVPQIPVPLPNLSFTLQL